MPLEHNGKLYARVTSDVLNPFVNFDSIPQDVLERKAALGTRVHDAIHKEVQGEFPVIGLQEQPYFKSFELWRAAVQPAFLMMEQRVYCDQKMITGCIDALVKLEGEDKGVLVDWKTSVKESAITWPMQAHLYHYLLQSAGISVASRFLFVKLDPYGGLPKVFQYKFDIATLSRCFQAIDDFWNKNVAVNS